MKHTINTKFPLSERLTDAVRNYACNDSLEDVWPSDFRWTGMDQFWSEDGANFNLPEFLEVDVLESMVLNDVTFIRFCPCPEQETWSYWTVISKDITFPSRLR